MHSWQARSSPPSRNRDKRTSRDRAGPTACGEQEAGEGLSGLAAPNRTQHLTIPPSEGLRTFVRAEIATGRSRLRKNKVSESS